MQVAFDPAQFSGTCAEALGSVRVRWPTCKASSALGVGARSELAKRPYVWSTHGANRSPSQMPAKPSGTHSKAVSSPLTGMKAYQLSQPLSLNGISMTGMATPNSPQSTRAIGRSESTQPTHGSNNIHNRSRQVAGSEDSRPMRRNEWRQ